MLSKSFASTTLLCIGFMIAGNVVPFDAISADVTANPEASLEEVIVTAQKQEERLQDVPIPLAVIGAQGLVENNQLRIQDYYTEVPGLNIAAQTESTQVLSIRGISTGSFNPTVGIVVDGVPYGSSIYLFVPDFDPGDLSRIEVLRGPQGTLYGASSLGGLISYVTVDPSTDRVSGRAEVNTSSVYNGAELGYTVRGSVNLPVSDTVAMRLSGFTREDPGYIDNPILHIDGINKDRANGGHIAALWKPSDSLSLKLNAFYQEIHGEGTNDVTALPGLGPWQQNYIPNTGSYYRQAQFYNAILDDKIGDVTLTALSGYNVYHFSDSFDYTSALGTYLQYGVPGTGFNGFGVPGTPVYSDVTTRKFTQEIRASAPLGSKVDGLLGLFYTHEASPFSQNIQAENPTTGQQVGQFFYTEVPTTLEEGALFLDFKYHVTDQFVIQLGGRKSEIRQNTPSSPTYGPYTLAFLGVPSPSFSPHDTASDSPFTYLVTPEFKISPDFMVYARLASGYRVGGPNTIEPGQPSQYYPDKTFDYEVGTKGDLLNHLVSFDASVYYIDWRDIQLSLVNPHTASTYTGNGGGAKSQGVELSVESRPVSGLKVAGWVSFADAVLTSYPNSALLSGLYAYPGDPLPWAPRFSSNFSVNEEFPIVDKIAGFLGGAVSYVGEREDTFNYGTPRQFLPAYAKTDVRAGLKDDSWTVNLYANNVMNRRGLISGGVGNSIPYSYYYIQPRTVGLSISKTF